MRPNAKISFLFRLVTNNLIYLHHGSNIFSKIALRLSLMNVSFVLKQHLFNSHKNDYYNIRNI